MKFLSNDTVNKVFPLQEDRDVFYREHKNGERYRKMLCKLIEYEIIKISEAEEDLEDGLYESVCRRKALRKLKSILTIGDVNAKG